MTDDDPGFEGGGFDVDDWTRLQPFAGRLATPDDVQRKAAIFALGDTHNGRVIDMPLPQPVDRRAQTRRGRSSSFAGVAHMDSRYKAGEGGLIGEEVGLRA